MKPLVPLTLAALSLLASAAAAPTFSDQAATVIGGVSGGARSASAGDYDGDGDPDLLIQANADDRLLLRNNTVGLGTADFTDVTALLNGEVDDNSGWSAAWGDHDGDGDVDVFLGQRNSGGATGDLLRNDGAMGFTDVSAATGLDDPEWHQNVVWCDIDGDADLDMLIGMELTPYEIYLQVSPEAFVTVGDSTGFATPTSHAYGMAVGDTDGDGDRDVYIATCSGNSILNHFFRNDLVEDGALGFTDITDATDTQYTLNAWHCEFQDFDDDGALDLFMVGASGNPSKIWLNGGGGPWTDVDMLSGHPLLSDTGSLLAGGRVIDYDNDGDLDLFVHEASSGSDRARMLYRNDGGWKFTDVTAAEGLEEDGLGAYDSAWLDFDLDGDLDLAAVTGGSDAHRLFVSSASTNGNHWLHVDLTAPPPNTTGIGAELFATIHAGTPDERTLRRDANANAGTYHQSDLPVHFGLGSAEIVDSLEIRWPDGTVQSLTDVPADQHMTAVHPTLLPPAFPTFTEVGTDLLGGDLLNARSISLADVDNDGDLDVLVQGNADARRLFLNQLAESGSLEFTDVTGTLWPALLDANDSGWSAAWSDCDGDGDVDVFLGMTNSNRTGDLMRNMLAETGSAAFVNVSASEGLIADPGFHQNVAWNDIDLDGDLDLIIAMEGPEPHEIYAQVSSTEFVAVGGAAGIQIPYNGVNHGKSYGMAIGDTDGDGDAEIYMSTCRSGGNIVNFFFDNRLMETGTLTFNEIADTNGTQYTPNSYHAALHDFDDDGDLDLLVVGADGEASKIWRNDGGGAWTDTDTLRGAPLLSYTGGDLNGARAVDFDNDGDLDLSFHDHRPENGRDVARLLFRNDGNWNFTNITPQVIAPTTAFWASNEDGYDSTWGDVDNDGDMDLLAATGSGWPERIFLSDQSENGNRWLHVRLQGLPPNTRAVGAAVYATVQGGALDGVTLRREANSNAGTFNQSDLPVHFGLADADCLSELRVIWPDGSETTLTDVACNQILTVPQPAPLPPTGLMQR